MPNNPTHLPLIITGAAGWLGRALSAHVAHNADGLGVSQLIALVRNSEEEVLLQSSLPKDNNLDLRILTGDVTNTSDIDRLFSSSSGAFDLVHTAGIIHPKKIPDLFAVNETATKNIMQRALHRGARRVVHISSNSPFGNNPHTQDTFRADEPFNPYLAYGASKMGGEIAVQESVSQGLNAVIVRPPWFYGPFQPARQTTFFSMVKSGKFPVFGDGAQRRSMVFIDNLVDGVCRARAWEGEPGRGWWIADTQAYRVSEIVETVGRALTDEGHTVKKNRLRLPHLLGQVAETADGFIQRTGRYVQQVHVLGEMNKTIACDISSATHDLGYVPAVSLYEGMRRSIRWCAQQGIEL